MHTLLSKHVGVIESIYHRSKIDRIGQYESDMMTNNLQDIAVFSPLHRPVYSPRAGAGGEMCRWVLAPEAYWNAGIEAHSAPKYVKTRDIVYSYLIQIFQRNTIHIALISGSPLRHYVALCRAI